MPTSDLKLFTQDSPRVGENVARTIRIIAKLLMDWSDAQRGSRAKNTKRSKKKLADEKNLSQQQLFPSSKESIPLDAITFDKLVVLFCRLWDMLYKNKLVRYKPAFLQLRGFHGPGRAIKINRSEDEKVSLGKEPEDLRHGNWAFATEIVEKLKPALSDTRILFRLEGKAWDPKCKIYPELDQSVWESWLCDIDSQEHDNDSKFLLHKESKYIDAISSVLSKLNKDELRAIGTHCSSIETLNDIEFNFKACRLYLDQVITFLRDNSAKVKIARSAYKMVTTSREILRKSNNNRKDYVSAWQKWNQFVIDVDIRDAFQTTQNEDIEIWEDENICRIREYAQYLLDFSLYIRCCLFRKGYVQILKKKEIDESALAYERLKGFVAHNAHSLPSYNEIQKLTNDDLGKKFDELRAILLSSLPDIDRLRDIGIP